MDGRVLVRWWQVDTACNPGARSSWWCKTCATTVVEIPHRRRTLMDLWCRYVTSPPAQVQGFGEKVRGASRAIGEPHDSCPKDRVEDVGGDDINLLGRDDVAVACDHLVRMPEQP